MSLAPGTRLGPYEIKSPIGAGGMGEVYRARDPRLEREVAVKILPPVFSGDPDRLRRFQQEARAAGALNHPNILAIHDVGTHDGVSYVVSELLEGSTLRDRLAGAAVPGRKAVEYALQIARGLAAAHDRGIVHRDLKPENVFVTHDGHVKILDFGLAKLTRPEHEGGALTNLPTTPAGTDPGMVMGTVGYMSPEQVRGQPSDQRSDIFSLGVILHEMVSGRQPFRRESPVETMSAILKEEPPELPATARVPPALERILRHCLEKSPAERFQSARDLAFDLEALSGISGPFAGEAWPGAGAPVASAGALRRGGIRFLAGLVAGLLAGAGAVHWLGRGEPPGPPTVRYLTYSGQDTEPSASPDGRLIAFASTRDGRQRIWLKQLPGGDEVALTAGPDTRPRISPDGSTVLFARQESARTSLFRIPVVGGDPRKVVEDASEGDWSPDGRRIAFLRPTRKENTAGWTIMVADADGRGARDLAHLDDRILFAPRWSPAGTEIAVTQMGSQNSPNSILILEVDRRETRSLSPPPPAG
ncbi:MAG: serine/threonine-protein kinase, partial [Acidobacteria bacterium]|nr:serine/threonine-protein kinase [Acidobacteriota bacterium]